MQCAKGYVTVLAAVALATGMAASAQAADVGVSLSFSQPGVYGRVDIGQFPQPQVIVQQPVMIAPPPPAMPPPEPVYLYVPYEHRKHWERHCEEYHACGRPVYFVNHVWYKNNVMAHRDEHHDRGRHEGQERHEGHENHGGPEGHDRHEGRGEDHDRGR